MPKTLHIDFVSDVVCPRCVVGLGGLEAALERLKGEGIEAEIVFRPFELNPDMAPEGENIVAHIGRKYGATPTSRRPTGPRSQNRRPRLGGVRGGVAGMAGTVRIDAYGRHMLWVNLVMLQYGVSQRRRRAMLALVVGR